MGMQVTKMTNKRALITGASAGLGKEFARQLAATGKNLILVARRREPMEKLAAELRDAHGIEIEILTADMGSEGPDLIKVRDWERQDAYLRLMMTSVAAMCHEFMPGMIEAGYGRVINVASVAGLMTVANDYSYGPTKAYLVALSKALASTYKEKGVNVMALCPGFTHTDFHASERLTAMKVNMPKFAWYSANVVIRDGLAAIEKGKDVCISGRLYRLLVPVFRQRWTQGLLKLLGVGI
jgi:short-subunit dehydrogenase